MKTFDDLPDRLEEPLAEVDEAFVEYYSRPVVRQRIMDFFGGTTLADATCEFITAGGQESVQQQPRSPAKLGNYLDRNCEVARSLWDRDSLIACLAIEYVNGDQPAEVYRNPCPVFAMQEPVVATILRLLAGWNIAPLQVLTGRGHSFIWRVSKDSELFHQSMGLGHRSPSLCAIDGEPHSPNGRRVASSMSNAFAGLGLVMEYLAHRVRELAAPHCAIPIEFTEGGTGSCNGSNPLISINLSAFGAPLDQGTLRAPFSFNHEPCRQRLLIGDKELHKIPQMIFIPMEGCDIKSALEFRCSPDRAVELAGRTSTAIPEQAKGTGLLVAEYLRSPLAAFHRWFYSKEQLPAARWPETYDRISTVTLPQPVSTILESPKDLLLQPASIHLIIQTLLPLGWHPRHIAGLVRSKIVRDHDLEGRWLHSDPATWADFQVRLFGGLFVVDCADPAGAVCNLSKEESTLATLFRHETH